MNRSILQAIPIRILVDECMHSRDTDQSIPQATQVHTGSRERVYREAIMRTKEAAMSHFAGSADTPMNFRRKTDVHTAETHDSDHLTDKADT